MHLQSRKFRPFTLCSVITAPAVLLILTLVTFSYSAESFQDGQPHPAPVQDVPQNSQGSNVNEDISLAAEQEFPDDANLYAEIPGIGSLFGTMLDSLISFTNRTESRFKMLYTSIPLIIPDLHKVFVTL